ncbi:MAG: phosphatase PAP2 family protein [Bacteroidaceae bacterium]|nr:phosphatase PAP2 family protein [Bacteroidaceae bacterium]
MSLEELNELDHELTLAVNGSDSLFWDNIMYTVTNTFSWSIVILVLLYIIFKNNTPREAIMIYISIALMIVVADRLCSGFVKPAVGRWRPTQDPVLMYLVDVVRGYRGGQFGFFSGHACNTFCMAVFLSLLFRDIRVTLTLIFWAATTTFTRIYLGVHYLGDITVGFLIGCTIGCVFYFLLKFVKQKMAIPQRRFISMQFTSSGYLISDMNVLLATVFCNYLIVVIVAMMLGIA